MRRFILAAALTVSLSFGSLVAQPDLNPEMLAMLKGWKESLNLSDEQSEQVKGLLQQMATKLEPLSEQADPDAESDKKAMFAQLKQVRAEFQTQMMALLDPDQQKAMAEIQAQIHQGMLTKIASKRAEKLQEQFQLSADQTQQIVPVYVQQMSDLEAFVEKSQNNSGSQSQAVTRGGQRRQRRAKIQQAKTLKSISEDADKAIKKILTEDQWKAYKAFRDEQKEQNKARRKQGRG